MHFCPPNTAQRTVIVPLMSKDGHSLVQFSGTFSNQAAIRDRIRQTQSQTQRHEDNLFRRVFMVEFHFLNTNIVLFLYPFQSLEERLKTTTFIYYWSINGEKRGATTFLRERTGRYSS